MNKLMRAILNLPGLSYLEYRFRLSELERLQLKVHEDHKPLVAKAKNYQEREELEHAEWSDYREIGYEIQGLRSNRLLKKAHRYEITIPSRSNDDLWEQSNYGEWVLTEKGTQELKSLIRTEKKERRDVIAWWVNMTLGLIGAMIALISVMKSN